MSKFEKKFGRYAVKNLALYLVIGYAIGYVFMTFSPMLESMLTLEPQYILKGQVWRLFTWILIPPSSTNIFFLAIMMLFYYNVGKTLEMVWGTYRFNLYIFGGMLFTIAGAFAVYFVMRYALGVNVDGLGYAFTTYYVNMSIFLAYACTFPNMEVLLMFLLPVKVKYLAVIYVVCMALECLQLANAGGIYAVIQAIVIICSLLNFLIFFFNRKSLGLNRQQYHVRNKFRTDMKEIKKRSYTTTMHKCAICGRTEESHPDLTFRYCSKCNGNYEYCEEHLFSHKHIE